MEEPAEHVPAESSRLLRRIRRRDRWFVALAAGGVLVATPPAVLLSGRSSAPGPGAGCITTIVTGFMGGETHTYCGADADAFCRSPAGHRGAAATDCRQWVLAADSSQP